MIKVSVVTAVYNGQATVAHAVESVLNQSHAQVESVVIDGGSTDGTLAVLDQYRSRIGCLLSEPDHGIYDALNKGIHLASGDVIGFLHADDIFENEHVLAKVASVFEDPVVEAVYGDLVYVKHGDVDRVIRYWKAGWFDRRSLANGWMPPHPTFYVRKSVYQRFGGFDVRYRIAADYDTVLRFLAIHQIRVVYVPETLVRMRLGGVSNRSLKTIALKTWEDVQVLRRNQVGGVWTVVIKNLRKLNQFWQR